MKGRAKYNLYCMVCYQLLNVDKVSSDHTKLQNFNNESRFDFLKKLQTNTTASGNLSYYAWSNHFIIEGTS